MNKTIKNLVISNHIRLFFTKVSIIIFLQSLFVCWIVFLPIIFVTGYAEHIKVFWFLGGGIILFPLLLLIIKAEIKFDITDFLYLGWLGILAISSFQGINFYQSVFGGSYRYQGILFFVFIWFTKKIVENLRPDFEKILVKFISFSLILESLVLAYQTVFLASFYQHPIGTIGESNAVVGFLLLAFFISLEIKNRKYILFLFLLTSIDFVLIGTKTALLLIAFPLIGIVFEFLPFINKTVVTILLSILFLVGLIYTDLYLKPNFSIYENREIIWQEGVRKFWQRPVLGYGAESTEQVYNQAFLEINRPLSGLAIDRSHNLFLDIALWSGEVGLLMFSLWLIFTGIKLAREKGNRSLGFIVFLFFAFINPLGVVHWVYLMVSLSNFKYGKKKRGYSSRTV